MLVWFSLDAEGAGGASPVLGQAWQRGQQENVPVPCVLAFKKGTAQK